MRPLTFRPLLWLLAWASLGLAQVVQEALPADPGPLDFIRGEGYTQWILQSLAGDALVGLDPRGRPVPRLARRWTLERDGSLAFDLRPGVRFGDGAPVTAADVLWTFQELQGDPAASPTKRAILQGAAFGVRAGRPWLRSPRAPGRLLLELARIPIARAGHADMGSGPFLLRREAGAWTFTRRDHFLAPQVDGIRFRLLPDPGSVATALRKGWLHLGAPVAGTGAPPPGLRWVEQPMHAQLVVWSRGGPGLLRWLEAWRRDAFPPRLLGRHATPARGLWPETLGFGPVAVAAPPEPPPRPRPLDLAYPAGDPLLDRVMLALAARAARDGWKLRPAPLEEGLLVARLRQGAFDLAAAMVVFEPHPWAVLEYLEPGGPMNFTGWTDPGLGAVLPRLRDPGDPAWGELQRLWARHPAALPLLDFRSALWVDRRLEVQASPLGLYLHTPGAAGWRWR